MKLGAVPPMWLVALQTFPSGFGGWFMTLNHKVIACQAGVQAWP